MEADGAGAMEVEGVFPPLKVRMSLSSSATSPTLGMPSGAFLSLVRRSMVLVMLVERR
jgi:hypothetical protein